MDDTADPALLKRLRALAPDDLDALLICAMPRNPDPELLAALAAPLSLAALNARLATLLPLLPTLLEASESPAGHRIVPIQREQLVAVVRELALDRWRALHERAAEHCARCVTNAGPRAQEWQAWEVHHLFAAEHEDRHARLDAAFRRCLRARDEAGCESLIAAAEEGDTADEPLVLLCRGLVATELSRDWGMAEAHLQRVLDRSAHSPSLHARALQALGILDRLQGRYEAALIRLERACSLVEGGDDLRTLATALNTRGLVTTEGWMHRRLPQTSLHLARTCLVRAIGLYKDLNEQQAELSVWNNLGILDQELGQPEAALADYREALRLVPPNHSFIQAALLNNIAAVDTLLGRLSAAQQSYTEVLRLWQETGGPFETMEALLNLGSVQECRGFYTVAVQSYRQAIAAVESLRAQLKAEEARTGFLGKSLAPYERLIALYLRELGGEGDAFEVVERAKARAFIELLAGKPLRPPEAVPPAMLEREATLRQALGKLYAMHLNAGAPGPGAARVASLETELEDLYRRMRRLDAQYAGSRSVEPLSLAEVQQRLPASVALLEYFSTGDEFGCFVIGRDTVTARLLPGAMTTVRRYLEAGGNLVSLGRAAGSGDAAPATWSQLADVLLAPIQGTLVGVERLYVAPHGPLHYLPLHALGVTPLLERYRVAYTPSASVLLREHAPEPDTRADLLPGCLALGFAGADLRYAELEAVHTAKLTDGVALVGPAASGEALLEQGPRFRILHLACHGTFNPQAPLASGLLLAGGKLDAMTVLQRLRLRADLVVLSACDTGQAEIQRGDELMGVARSFLYAGAASVLVSLWPVDDLATALLMDRFYRAYLVLPPGPDSAADALRHAQLALRVMSAGEALALAVAMGVTPAAADADEGTDVDGTDVQVPRTVPLPAAAVRGILTSEQRSPERKLIHSTTACPYGDPFYWAAFVLIRG